MQKNIQKKSMSKNEHFSSNSSKIEVKGNQKYEIQTQVTAKKGVPYSAYFSAVMLDSGFRELARKIRWLSDFNGNRKNYELIFTTTPETKYIILSYRFNVETPVKSDLDVEFEDISTLTPLETKKEEVFDDITKYKVPILPPLTNEQEESFEKKIVWLCSPPRSGTTWLGTRLLNHPENVIWHEPWIGFHLGVLQGGLTPAKDFADASPEAATKLESKKIPIITYNFQRILDMQATNGEYFFSLIHKNNWLPYLRKLILARTYSHAQTLKKNVIIKDPVGSNGTDILSECLPNSKIIFLIRDGRDEVDSRIDMHSPGSWAKLRPFKTKKARLQGIAYYSQLWTVNTNNIKKGYDSHNSDLKMMLKYENLKENTLSELRKIYDFIKIKISDDELKKIIGLHEFKNIPKSETGGGKFNRAAKIGGWKASFNVEEREVMNSIMDKTLKEFGYKI